MTIEQTREPTPEEVLELIRATARGALRGLMPARVASYDAAAQTVTVTPAIRRRRADESYTDDPTLTVPWRCLRVGACAVHLEPSAGDWVGLLVGERSLDEWMGDARVGIEPADARRFDLSDAIAYPLLTPDGGDEPTTRIEVRADGVVTITAAEVRLGDDSALALAIAELVNANFSAMRTAYNSHTHTATGATAPTTTPVVPLGAFGDVDASKAKGV